MTKQELLDALIAADGAILYWQLPKSAVEDVVASGDAYIANDDCLVLKTATKIDDGAYTLQQ